jgi:hypothetical protein
MKQGQVSGDKSQALSVNRV